MELLMRVFGVQLEVFVIRKQLDLMGYLWKLGPKIRNMSETLQELQKLPIISDRFVLRGLGKENSSHFLQRIEIWL